MNWILLVMAGIAAVVVAMLVGGALAPRTRTATRTLRIAGPAAELYRRLREVDGPPRWCADLPTMRVMHEDAPRALTLTLCNDDGHPMGTWEITVHAPVASGERDREAVEVRITESVTVENLLWRFVHSIGGSGARPQRFLEAVAGQFGVTADVRAG